MTSEPGRITDAVTLLEQAIATAEFLVVDTETNGLGGDACEMTEVGAVLVGGGELHDRWSSLVRCNRPLGRGIQRFTGITQEMLADAPGLEEVLPPIQRLLENRVLVAHNAPFDRRVLRQGFQLIGLEWPNPPVLCTAALARKLLPLQRRRGLGVLADALGIEVDTAHRALADAETCARVLCALFPRLCANALTIADAMAIAGQRRRRATARKRRTPALTPPPQLDFADLPKDPGVYLFRNEEGRVLYVGKSISIRSRARAHFAPSSVPADWTVQASVVDYQSTNSELGALVLENRLIKRHRPPGNIRLTKSDDRLCYIRCRLDIAFPILEVSSEPAAGHAVTIGPLRGRRLAQELVEQLDSLFGLRHCGRRLRLREHPSAYGQMGRCLSPCLGDLDPNLYRRRLDEALRLFTTEADGRDKLLAHVRGQMREAAARQHYERAAWLAPADATARRDPRAAERHARGHPRAGEADPRHAPGRRRPPGCVLARRRPSGGLGPRPPGTAGHRRSGAAYPARVAARRPGGARRAHPARRDRRAADHRHVPRFAPRHPAAHARAGAAQRNGSSVTSAVTESPTATVEPGGASRRTSARPIGPNRGD